MPSALEFSRLRTPAAPAALHQEHRLSWTVDWLLWLSLLSSTIYAPERRSILVCLRDACADVWLGSVSLGPSSGWAKRVTEGGTIVKRETERNQGIIGRTIRPATVLIHYQATLRDFDVSLLVSLSSGLGHTLQEAAAGFSVTRWFLERDHGERDVAELCTEIGGGGRLTRSVPR